MYIDNNSAIPLRHPNKKFFLLFFICCSLPFIAAKLALEFSWFTPGVTNKGQWLEDGVKLFPGDHKQHWHLVYVQAQACNRNCELALSTLQQIYMGLGRQQDQLNVMLIADQAPSQLTHYPAVHWQTSDIHLAELQEHILIVNQDGLAILRYAVAHDQEHMLVVGKDIR